MYDFAQNGLVNSMQGTPMGLMNDVAVTAFESTKKAKGGKKKEIPEPKKISPKEVFKAGGLNAKDFSIKVDPEYIAKNLQFITEKEDLYGKKPKDKRGRFGSEAQEWGAKVYGRMELASIKERLENRLKISQVKGVVAKYPHATSELISELLKKHDHLKCGEVSGFVPDFPKEAVNAMKEYNQMCIDLCGKRAVFYVIAKKADFEIVGKKRDPILLAQSPFGFFWQVLGAWDEEMEYLADL
jgi:hypothetical protein